MDEARKKRAAALEEKKKRLEEMRKKRAEREEGGTASATGGAGPSAAQDDADLNSYINTLLSAPPPPAVAGVAVSQGTSKDRDDDTGASSRKGDHGASEEAVEPSSTALAPPRTPVKITVVTGLGKVTVAPVTVEVYEKGTQTDLCGPDVGALLSPDGETPLMMPLSSPSQMRTMRRGSRYNTGHAVTSTTTTMGDDLEQALALSREAEAGARATPASAPKKTLTSAQKDEILSQSGFKEFLARSSLVVERLLGKDEFYDAFVDYGLAGGRERKRRDSEAVTRILQFHDEKLSAARAVMDVHWSPHYAELLLAAYNTHSLSGLFAGDPGTAGLSAASGVGAGGDPDGLVLVWSLALPGRPEFTFTSQAPVLTARFHDQDPHVIIGGTYSGQIVLWDTRAKSLPVQRTPLSTSGHTHPVYSIAQPPTAASAVTLAHGGNALVSASSDGRVCLWNLSQLNQPLEVFEVKYEAVESAAGRGGGGVSSPASSLGASDITSPTGGFGARRGGARAIPITALAFDNEKGTEELMLGSESGQLYSALLHKGVGIPSTAGGAASARGGVASVGGGSSALSHGRGGVAVPAVVRQYDGHFGLVTALARHPLTSASSAKSPLAPLLLSSSVDWSMRVWNLRKSPEPLAVLYHGTYDYVCDVKWSPTHPAVFASVTSGGDLHLWNLNQSFEIPLSKGFSVAGTERPRCALTRLAWSTEGRKIAVGDARGCVHVLGVAEEVSKARLDEELRLEMALESRSKRGKGAADEGEGEGEMGLGAADDATAPEGADPAAVM